MWVFGSFRAGFDRGGSEFELLPGRELTLGVEILGRQVLNLLWPWSPDMFRPMQPALSPGSAGFLVPALAAAGLGLAGVLAWHRRAGLLVVALAAFLLPILPGFLCSSSPWSWATHPEDHDDLQG
jgi:hypothetical protein